MTTLKLCRCCGERKPATPEHFYVHKLAKDGWQSRCKLCQAKKNREDYERRLAQKPPQRKRDGIKPKERKSPETELELAIEAFLAGRKNLSPNTLKNYESTLFFFSEAHPDFPPTPQGVTDWLAAGGYKPASKRNKFGSIRAFCHWLVKTKRLDSDPLVGFVRPPKEDLLPRAPRERDVLALFDYLEKRVELSLKIDSLQGYRAARDLVAFSLMLDTGLRVSEVVGLDIEDVDLEEGSAFVSHSKTGSQRYVMFGKRVKGNLKLWLKVRSELGIPKDVAALFVSERAGWRRSSTAGFRNMLIQHCQEAGAKRFSPHQLRHACACQGINNGQHIEDLRQQLGHRDIAMTARYFRMPSTNRRKNHLRTSPLDNLKAAA